MPEELYDSTGSYLKRLYNATVDYLKKLNGTDGYLYNGTDGLLKQRYNGTAGYTVYIDVLRYPLTLLYDKAYRRGLDGGRVFYVYDRLGNRFLKWGPHPWLAGISFEPEELTLDEVIQDIKERSGDKSPEVNVDIASGASKKFFSGTLFPLHERLERELNASVKLDFLERALLEPEYQDGKEIYRPDEAYINAYHEKKRVYDAGYLAYLNDEASTSAVQEISANTQKPVGPADNAAKMTSMLGLFSMSSTLMVQTINYFNAIETQSTQSSTTELAVVNFEDHKASQLNSSAWVTVGYIAAASTVAFALGMMAIKAKEVVSSFFSKRTESRNSPDIELNAIQQECLIKP
jgi:hypothetical protein